MQAWGSTNDSLILFTLLFLFGAPILALVGWAIVRGSKKGVSLWRTLGTGFLVATVTISAVIGWGYLWFTGPVYRAVARSNAGEWILIVVVLGFLLIPIAGIVLGIYAIRRVGRARSKA